VGLISGEILGGIELVRKVQNAEVHAMTIPLVLNSSGEKLGKERWQCSLAAPRYDFSLIFQVRNRASLFQLVCSLTHRQYLFNIYDASSRGVWSVV